MSTLLRLPVEKKFHFAAISAILETRQHHCDFVHIMNYCHGVQWPTMIKVVAHMHKTLKLTSIKWDGGGFECVSSPSNFEETSR